MRNTKGTSTILEQVLVMLFGVMILITVIVTFSQVKTDTVEYSAVPQFGAVAQHVHAVVASAAIHMQHADTGNLGIVIPRKIAGQDYIVRVNSTHVKVENFEKSINTTVPLVQANVTVSGTISSGDSGKARAFFNATSKSITFTRV